jgi:osmotically-inducible protein OsmY
MSALTAKIEQRLAHDAGVDVIVEEDGDTLVLTGFVDSDRLKQAALEIASDLAGGKRLDDNIEVVDAIPEELGSGHLSEVAVGMFTGATPDLREDAALSPGDFTDQRTLVDPLGAAGPSSSEDDAVSEGDYVYVPPIDPVGTNREVLGGFQTDALEHIEVERSELDGRLGDEPLADAIRQQLRLDASTTDLQIEVEVENRVARLRGRVQYMDDAENAEAVAASVPGIIEVQEELEVEGM